jgi:hypothetical protein
MNHCANCNKPGATKTCGKCKAQRYCSKECQSTHWKSGHKVECCKSKEDLMFLKSDQNNVAPHQLAIADSFFEMGLSRGNVSNSKLDQLKRIKSIYNRTPDLVNEFKQFMRESKISDIPMKEALKLLSDITILNKAVFMKEILFYYHTTESHTNPLLKDASTLCKRIHSTSEEKIKWYFNARQFDVYLNETVGNYETSIYHSFSNCRARTERFVTGKLHIAVGFVDLSLLLWMDLECDINAGPFKFIGFENSAFSVAKTLVISCLLEHADDGIEDAILQIWYSSCWSSSTLRFFQLGVGEAIKICNDEEVMGILRHWSKANAPSVSTARAEWLKKVDETSFDPVVNSSKLNTRNKLCQYFLTGQLLPATVGSIAMFCLPLKYEGARSRNESCFHSLDLPQLVFHTKGNNDDFVAGAIALLRKKIKKLNSLVLNHFVTIKIEPPTMVSLDFPKAISKISAMNPYSISWNNCLDYFPISEFHRLARAISGPEDTVHYGYSMNWPTDVKGACSLDYPVGEDMIEKMEIARHYIKVGYVEFGLADLFIFPPIDNPINVLDNSLRTMNYRYWANAFFKTVPNVGQVEPTVLYNLFERSGSAVFLTWTYDESISFSHLK